MHPDTVEVIVHRLRALVDEKPQQAMDELESLVKQLSVRELTEILCAVYVEISGEMGIDWHFTALQWKLGNRARQQVLPTSRDARFPVWSFAFLAESGSGSETRYTTCLPFSFKSDWLPRDTKAARTTST
jgi:hypothetical protein